MSNIFKCLIADKKLGTEKQVGSIAINDIGSEKAELRFYGDIVSSSWESYCFDEDKCPQDISDFLSEIPSNKDIDIYINSGGGNVHAGLAIFNQLKRHDAQITVHVDGIAASTAGFLAMVGDKIIMPEATQLMMHKPWSNSTGDADKMRKQAELLDLCQNSIADIFMLKAKKGVTKENVMEMLDKETWLSGSQAAEFFDIEVEQGQTIMNCMSDYFKKYKNLPQNLKEKSGAEEEQKMDCEKLNKQREAEKQTMLLKLDVI